MITQNGTIKVSTEMSDRMQKELTRQPYIMALVFIIVGAIGTALFLVFEIVSVFMETEDDDLFIYLIVFAVFLGLGIGLLALLRTSYKTVKALVKVNEYEFCKDYFIVDQLMNGEVTAHAKVYNHQITKTKETKNYLFLYLGAAAYPVEKSVVTEAELNTIKAMFRLHAKGNTVNLAGEITKTEQADKAEEVKNAVKPQTESAQDKNSDPFEEF